MKNPVVASEIIMLVRCKNDFAERKTTVVVLCHDTIENVEKVVSELEQVFDLTEQCPYLWNDHQSRYIP